MKSFFVNGWFKQPGLRINLEPNNGLGQIYDGSGLWLFHGYFDVDDLSGKLTGWIHDLCGHATIAGSFKGDFLSFDKSYVHRRDTIEYRFTKAVFSENTYSGGYNGDGVGKGDARMHLVEVPKDFLE